MNNTPQSVRLHIGIFGDTNVGKSSLFNALTGTDIAITSDISGTTTDSVQKAMELIPFGAVVLVDTAGLNDITPLGKQRTDKTRKVLNRVDLALYLIDGSSFSAEEVDNYHRFSAKIQQRNTPHIAVITKNDLSAENIADFPAIAVSIHQPATINALKQEIVNQLFSIQNANKARETLIGDLLPKGSTVLLVAPIDSAAPKGRLILPQAQLIRDCLDNGCIASIVTEKEVTAALVNLKKVDLVVTDSQVFGEVDKLVPQDIPLTSFSILMARQKGDISELLDGIAAIKSLKNGDKILVSEVCTHNRTHEDIGQVKIPAAMQKITGLQLNFEFTAGRDFPDDLTQYALIVHCGACMITAKEMQSRIIAAKQAKVPITNYGLFLAFASGILKRGTEILERAGIE
ncbi:MAG: [FeFe] hydrogenase H-cluster maturation GTPase HydF [Defluviitaleaceae bacterium]|nr:[FeFe] hydrogenase H-cluster maturation GTPase HydF [Defluviitaleaceae bacterium]